MSAGRRLSPTDAWLLHLDRPAAPNHITELRIFDGGPIDSGLAMRRLEGRLHELPRLRQKLAFVPFGLGRPVWVDDAEFRLEHHVRRVMLPAPGTTDQLYELSQQFTSVPLDKRRPLWELVYVDGVDGGRSAALFKVHHVMMDGVTAHKASEIMWDVVPDPGVAAPSSWEAEAEPTKVRLAIEALVDRAFEVRLLWRSERPIGERLRTAREAIVELAREAWRPAPPMPFNGRVTPYRKQALARVPLTDFDAVRRVLGGTLNDVALTIIAGGIGSWLRARGTKAVRQDLKVVVPVSTRTGSAVAEMGNQVAAVTTPVPIDERDAVERFLTIRGAMDDVKSSRQRAGAEAMAGLFRVSATAMAAIVHVAGRKQRRINVVCSNVPGPRFPLYLAGRRCTHLAPFAPLIANLGLFIALGTYDTHFYFGLNADASLVPDVADLAGALEAAGAELADAVRRVEGAAAAG